MAEAEDNLKGHDGAAALNVSAQLLFCVKITTRPRKNPAGQSSLP